MTMTEAKPEQSIAEVIRDAREPRGEMADLSAKAQRLSASVAVADKWIEASMEGRGSTELCSLAEKTRDELEEELARVVYRMDLLDKTRFDSFGRVREEDLSEDEAFRAGLLSDQLLEAYCVLRVTPEEFFGVVEGGSSRRTRYAIMGALLVAMDALTES
jgi:hypothetical protein